MVATTSAFRVVIAAVGLALLGWIANGAAAQTPKPPPAPPAAPAAPVSPDPVSTSASYGDWVLRCQRVGEGDKARRLCEVAQIIQLQGQQAPLAQVAFGKPSTGDPLRMTAALPPNISIPSSVTIAPGDKQPAAVDLAWRRCLPGACIADGLPSADALKVFRAAAEPGRLTFRDASGRDIGFPLSFRGLAQALDALQKT